MGRLILQLGRVRRRIRRDGPGRCLPMRPRRSIIINRGGACSRMGILCLELDSRNRGLDEFHLNCTACQGIDVLNLLHLFDLRPDFTVMAKSPPDKPAMAGLILRQSALCIGSGLL